jgi:hypothetical protein
MMIPIPRLRQNVMGKPECWIPELFSSHAGTNPRLEKYGKPGPTKPGIEYNLV